jgi:hypothetical protein
MIQAPYPSVKRLKDASLRQALFLYVKFYYAEKVARDLNSYLQVFVSSGQNVSNFGESKFKYCSVSVRHL